MSRINALFVAAGLAVAVLPCPAAAAIDLVGRTSATIHWEQASGPVAYYGIFISRNGRPFRERPNAYALAAFPYYKVKGRFGDSFRFKVAAYDVHQNRGPLSGASHEIRFVAPQSQIELPSFAPALGSTQGRHDFDGDHVPDAIFHDPQTGDLLMLLGGDFEAGAVAVASESDPAWEVVAVLDLNGDGRDDLYWRHRGTGDNRIWLMNGRTRYEVSTPPNPDRRWKVVASGDFDGNGQEDLLWHHSQHRWLMVWHTGPNILRGRFERAVAYPIVGDGAWQVGAVGDFDADGVDDLLWHRPPSGEVKAWYMEAVRHEESAFPNVAPEAMQVLAAGDFDGDGREDLFWRQAAEGWNEIWFMDGGDAFEAVAAPDIEPDWSLLATGDLNGDGRDDLVWTDAARDRVHRWLMEGAQAHASVVR